MNTTDLKKKPNEEDVTIEEAPVVERPPLWLEVEESKLYKELSEPQQRSVFTKWSMDSDAYMKQEGVPSSQRRLLKHNIENKFEEFDYVGAGDIFKAETFKQVGQTLVDSAAGQMIGARAASEVLLEKIGVGDAEFAKAIDFEERVGLASLGYIEGAKTVFKDRTKVDESFDWFIEGVTNESLPLEHLMSAHKKVLSAAAELNEDSLSLYSSDKRNIFSPMNAELLAYYKVTRDPKIKKLIKQNLTTPFTNEQVEKRLSELNQGYSQDFINKLEMATDPVELGFTALEFTIGMMAGGAGAVSKTSRGVAKAYKKTMATLRKAVTTKKGKLALGAGTESLQEMAQLALQDPEATWNDYKHAVIIASWAGGSTAGAGIGFSMLLNIRNAHRATKGEKPLTEEEFSEEFAKEEELVDVDATEEIGGSVEPGGETVKPEVEQIELDKGPKLSDEKFKEQKETADANRETVDAEVAELKEEIGLADEDIVVVDTVEELPGDARKQSVEFSEKGEVVEGMFIQEGEQGQGKVYLVRGNLGKAVNEDGSVRTVAQVFAHETVGHKGVEGLFKTEEEFNTYLDDVWSGLEGHKKMQEIVGREDADMDVTTPEGQRKASAEMIAELAENPELDPTLWKRIVEAVKKTFGNKLTETDIQNLIKDAKEGLKAKKVELQPVTTPKQEIKAGVAPKIVEPKPVGMKKAVIGENLKDKAIRETGEQRETEIAEEADAFSTAIAQAEVEGKEAWDEGETQNPHQPKTPEHEGWQAGWQAEKDAEIKAEAEEKKARSKVLASYKQQGKTAGKKAGKYDPKTKKRKPPPRNNMPKLGKTAERAAYLEGFEEAQMDKKMTGLRNTAKTKGNDFTDYQQWPYPELLAMYRGKTQHKAEVVEALEERINDYIEDFKESTLEEFLRSGDFSEDINAVIKAKLSSTSKKPKSSDEDIAYVDFIQGIEGKLNHPKTEGKNVDDIASVMYNTQVSYKTRVKRKGYERLNKKTGKITKVEPEIVRDNATESPHRIFAEKGVVANGLDDIFTTLSDYGLENEIQDLEALRTYIIAAANRYEVLEGKAEKEGVTVSEYAEGKRGDRVKYSKRKQQATKTKTPAFKRWFGKSKVVDDNGDPLVVYHGSPDARGIWKEGFIPSRMRGEVYFAAESRRVAETYADDRRAFDYQGAEAETLALYVSMQNPLVIDAKGQKWRETEKRIGEAKKGGYDGVIIKNTRDDYGFETSNKTTTVYAWFKNTQAKSATKNTGAFNPTDPRIQYSKRKQPKKDLEGQQDLFGADEDANAFQLVIEDAEDDHKALKAKLAQQELEDSQGEFKFSKRKQQGFGPISHLTKTKLKSFSEFDTEKSSSSGVWGKGIYASIGEGKWNPSHLKGGNVVTGFVSGEIIDGTKPIPQSKLDKLSSLVKRTVKTIPFISLEKRYGSVTEGLKRAGFSAFVHEGPGKTGKHIVVFDKKDLHDESTPKFSKRMGKGKFAIRVTEDERLAEEFNEANIPIEYEVEGMQETQDEANAIIKKNASNLDATLNYLIKNTKDIAGAVMSQTQQILVLRSNKMGLLRTLQAENARKKGDDAKADRLDTEANVELDRGIRIANLLVELGREAGRTVQAFAAWAKMSPLGFLRLAQTEIEKAQSHVKQKKKDEIDTVTKGLKKAGEEGVEKVPKTKGVVGMIIDVIGDKPKKTTPGKPKKTAEGRDIWGEYSDYAADKLLKVLTKGDGKKREAPVDQFTQNLIKNIGDSLREFLPEPEVNGKPKRLTDMELLKEAVKNWEKYTHVWEKLQQEAYDKFADNPAALEQITELFGAITINPVSGKVMQGIVRAEIKDMQIAMSDLVRQWHKTRTTSREAFREQVREKLQGLTEEQIDTVTDTLLVEYDKQVETARKKELQKLIKASEPKVKEVAKIVNKEFEKLLGIINMDGLNNQAVYNAIAESMGLPAYTPEFARKITRMAEAVQAAPGGFQQNNLAKDLLNEIALEIGISNVELMASMAYANMLSGPFTHMVNIGMGGINLVANLASQMMMSPTMTPTLLKGAVKGFGRGMIEAATILRTGNSRLPQFTEKLGAAPLLELVEKTSNILYRGKINPMRLQKLILRSLSAGDAIIRLSAQEMKAMSMAKRVAQKEGLKGKKLKQRTEELLFNSEKDIESATKRATKEGLTGLEKKNRFWEIQEQTRDPGIQKTAWQFGGIVSFNHEPYGIIGFISKHTDAFFSGGMRVSEDLNIPGGKAVFLAGRVTVVPFTRIVGNVLNASLDYTPAGVRHKALPVNDWGAGEGFRTDDFKRDAIGRATLGTMTAAGLLAYAMQFKDDDDPEFWIYGKGPTNTQDRYLWQETGAKQYSIKWGDDYYIFKESVFGLGLGIIGNYLDSFKFDDRAEPNDGHLDRLAASVLITGTSAFDMSFVKGIQGTLEIVSGKGYNLEQKLTRLLARPVSSLLPGSAMWSQLDKLNDSTYYEAKGIRSILMSQVPVVRRYNRVGLNVFGQKVNLNKNDGLDRIFTRFGSTKVKDPVINFIVNNDLQLRPAGKGTKILKRSMTEDELYELTQKSGPEIYNKIKDYMKRGRFDGLDKEKMQDKLTNLVGKERKRVKSVIRKRLLRAGG